MFIYPSDVGIVVEEVHSDVHDALGAVESVCRLH
jgi:hypothetical protein